MQGVRIRSLEPATPRAAGLPALAIAALIASLFFAACASGPGKAEYDAQSAELLKAREQAADAAAKLQENQLTIETLKQTNNLDALHISDLETRVKAQDARINDLETTNAKLDDLLNEVQTLQLNKLVNPAALPGMELQTSSTPVSSLAINPDAAADSSTQTGNPAETSPVPAALSAAAGTPVGTTIIEPSPTPSPSPSPSPTPPAPPRSPKQFRLKSLAPTPAWAMMCSTGLNAMTRKART